MKKTFLSLAIAVLCLGAAMAADEAPLASNFGLTQMGLYRTSTGTATGETRNMTVTADGVQKTWSGSNRSTWTVIVTSSKTYIRNTVDRSTPTNTALGVNINENVHAVATPASPVLVRKLIFGQGCDSADRVELFDSRGSTVMAQAGDRGLFFDVTASTPNTPPYLIDHEVTSGLTLRKTGGASGDCGYGLYWTIPTQ